MRDSSAPPGTSPTSSVLREPRTFVAGAILALSCLAPLFPTGESAARWCVEAFDSGALQGLYCLSSVGLPFLLGGVIAASCLRRSPREPGWIVPTLRGGAFLLHVQLLVFATAWLREPALLGRLPLFGFALVSCLAFAIQSEQARLRLVDLPTHHARWLIRWIAAILAPFASWCRLQSAYEIRLGIAIELVLLASLLLVFSTGRGRR